MNNHSRACQIAYADNTLHEMLADNDDRQIARGVHDWWIEFVMDRYPPYHAKLVAVDVFAWSIRSEFWMLWFGRAGCARRVESPSMRLHIPVRIVGSGRSCV